ncbi:SAM-dependent methyltransferase [Oleiharenicola lentus]|uniref:SAM-dependent methyltransferase n=1 Tax=Oleiharenicola lentus TaxID=2508720 RepID=A0A4Q1CB58_9BACT|nr:SAM-dependent methyltransferase [Oleiharenicola lentus]RXK56146.1 SAM-dependent methyltransferase [Oleiharenicola lentus]
MTVTPQEDFATRLDASVRDGTLARLTLGKPRGGDPTLQKIIIRPVTLKAGPHLSFVYRHDTRDITKNLPPAEAVREITRLVGTEFHSAHLDTTQQGVQLEFNKKGEPRLHLGRAAAPFPTDTAHDRAKPRLLTAEAQSWLHALGVTNAAGVVRDGLADKHRQIHKFTEILSHLVAEAPLTEDRPIEITDMGCGKGYLTFATHDYFDLVLKRSARVCGVEARPELVTLCNKIAHDTGRPKLSFVGGTIQNAELPDPDVLIALHACDTATDDALTRGIKAGATLIVVSPCCQKELRPQLKAAPVLAPALRHGIWQERHAEFVTDALRALLLEWAGYDTKVFEFISTEHTAKNLMIAATKRPGLARDDAAATKIRELAAFYGITSQSLARQLGFSLNHG